MTEVDPPEVYEAPEVQEEGSVLKLAQGSYSEGQSDDGDFSTVKWKSG